MSELKPCRCGSNDMTVVVLGSGHAVSCDVCGRTGARVVLDRQADPEAIYAAAISAWNADRLAEQKALEALEQVEAACKETFRDAGTPGHHTTVSCCPLCGSSWECDEDCPRHLVKQALALLRKEE